MARRPTDLAALPVAALVALAVASATGCQGFQDLQDLELARGEARFVTLELAATLGVAMADARGYTMASAEAQIASDGGATVEADGCADVSILESLGADGAGAVRYDFGRCSGRAGAVIVNQEIARDAGASGGAQGGAPPEVPPGTEADSGVLEDLGAESASFQVIYANYANGALKVSGHMDLTEEGDAGTLDALVSVGALDYVGEVDLAGSWVETADAQATRTSATGSFVSATGVAWDVVADNVGFQPGCMDGVGGALGLIHDGPYGRVTVQATFDAVCDGCADLVVDGEDLGRACFGDGVALADATSGML